MVNKIDVQPLEEKISSAILARYIIQLDISDAESDIDIIKRLKEIFSFFSILKSEIWVIGNNIKSAQTKQTVEKILENEKYDSISFFLIENSKENTGNKIYIKQKTSYILYLEQKYTELKNQMENWHEYVIKMCYLCRNNELPDESIDLESLDKKIDTKDIDRINDDPYILKIYNSVSVLKYEMNIECFNYDNNGKIVPDLTNLKDFKEMETELKKYSNENIYIRNLKNLSLLNFDSDNGQVVSDFRKNNNENSPIENIIKNNEMLSELTYFHFLKEIEICYINELNKYNKENEKLNKYYDYEENDVFDHNKCRQNRLIIKSIGYSIPNPFEKMLEKFEIFDAKIFVEDDKSNKIETHFGVKYQSFEISKIFEKMLRTTIHDSIVLTEMSNKQFSNYLINLWRVILNESELFVNEKSNEVDKDIERLVIYIHSAVYLNEYIKTAIGINSHNIKSAKKNLEILEQKAVDTVKKYSDNKSSEINKFMNKMESKNLIKLAIQADMKLFLSEDIISDFITDNTKAWFIVFHFLYAVSQLSFLVLLVILLIGDPRCNNEQVQPGQENIQLNCFRVFSLHFYNLCWVSSKICNEICEFFFSPIIYKRNLKLNLLEIGGSILYFIAWSRKFSTDFRFIYVYAEDDIYRIMMCVTFLIFMIVSIEYLSFFDYFRIKITILFYMIKQILGFGIFLVAAIISFGIVVQTSMFSSFGVYNQSLINKFIRNIIGYAFYPIFGNTGLYSDYFADQYFDENYSRDKCMNQKNMTTSDGVNCPYRTGVMFAYVGLMFYLILMNIVFINLLISTFGSVYDDIQNKSNQIIKFEDAVNYIEARRKLSYIMKKVFLLPPFSIFILVLIGPMLIVVKWYLKNTQTTKNKPHLESKA